MNFGKSLTFGEIRFQVTYHVTPLAEVRIRTQANLHRPRRRYQGQESRVLELRADFCNQLTQLKALIFDNTYYVWINPSHSHPATWETFLPLALRAQHTSCFDQSGSSGNQLTPGNPSCFCATSDFSSFICLFFSLDTLYNFHFLLFTMPLTLYLCLNPAILAFTTHFSLAE